MTNVRDRGHIPTRSVTKNSTTVNWFEFKVVNWFNKHRKFSLKCIICNLPKLQYTEALYKLLFTVGQISPKGQTSNYYYLEKMKLKDNLFEIKPIYGTLYILTYVPKIFKALGQPSVYNYVSHIID